MKYRTEIITSIDNRFIKQWQHLWKHAEHANIYNSYEWFRVSIETNNIKAYEIYAVFRDDTLVALLPLENYRVFGVTVYGTINKNHMVDTGFLMEKYDKTLFKQLFTPIMEKKNVYLQKVDSDATAILKKLYPNTLFSLISVNPYITLTKDLYSSISQSTLARIKRIIKKNESSLRFEMHKTDLEKPLKTMLKLQENSSKKARSMDIFEKEETRRYYQNIIKYCAEFVRINILYLGNDPIVYELGFKFGTNYLGDQISYHNEYKKYAPGKLLIYYLMEGLQKQGVVTMDQGGGISSYKMSFANNYKFLYNVYYSKNPLTMLNWKLINKARRVRQVIRPRKYTRDHEFLFKTL